MRLYGPTLGWFMKRFFTSAAVLVALSSFAPFTVAQPPPPAASGKTAGADEPEWKIKLRRQALFDEGQKLLEQGKPKEALAKFREVYGLRAHPRVLLWMALAEEQLGRLLKARAIYEQAKVDAREAKLDDVEQDAIKALGELTPKIPRLLVRVSSEAWFSVQIDSATATLKNGRIELDPGKHMMVVTAPGQTSYSKEVTLRAGEEKTITAFLNPAEPPPEKPWGGCAGCTTSSSGAGSSGGGLVLLALPFARRVRRRRAVSIRSGRS